MDKEKGVQKDQAWSFYDNVASILGEKGVDVHFDEGKPKTSPRKDVDYWIGHSRGGDRLRWAPPHIKTLRLDEYEDNYSHENQLVELPVEKRPLPPESHYTITPKMKDALRSLIIGSQGNNKEAK